MNAIHKICADCGIKPSPKVEEGFTCTFNKGVCNICKKETHITNVRNYQYLKGSKYYDLATKLN